MCLFFLFSISISQFKPSVSFIMTTKYCLWQRSVTYLECYVFMFFQELITALLHCLLNILGSPQSFLSSSVELCIFSQFGKLIE